MLNRRTPRPFSPVYVLERVWILKKARWARLLEETAPSSQKSLSRALIALVDAGFLRVRKAPRHLFKHRPPRIWRLTPLGGQFLGLMMPYRDLWVKLQPRDMAAYGRALATQERLFLEMRALFPETARNLSAWHYGAYHGPQAGRS